MSDHRPIETESGLPFRAISDCMRVDYRLRVIRAALGHYRDKRGPASDRMRLERAMQESVRLNGFRRPHLAISSPKAEELCLETAAAFHYYSNLTAAVLRLWVDSQSVLAAEMGYFVAAAGGTSASAFDKGGFTGAAPAEAMRALGDFNSADDQVDQDDVVLMFCCLTGYLPGECGEEYSGDGAAACDGEPASPEPIEAAGAQMDEMKPLRWTALLTELAKMQPGADEWDEQAVSFFTDSLHRLAADKRLEREKSWEQLRGTLAALVKEHERQLRVFELNDVSSWRAESCSITEAPHVAEHVARLHSLLDHYAGVGQEAPSTVRERRKLEDQILVAHADLSALLQANPDNAVESAGADETVTSAADAAPCGAAPRDASTDGCARTHALPTADIVAQPPPGSADEDLDTQPSEERRPTEQLGASGLTVEVGQGESEGAAFAPNASESASGPASSVPSEPHQEALGLSNAGAAETGVPAQLSTPQVLPDLEAESPSKHGVSSSAPDNVGRGDGAPEVVSEAGSDAAHRDPIAARRYEPGAPGAETSELIVADSADETDSGGEEWPEPARHVSTTADPPGAEQVEFMWSLVMAEDIAGAYWFARSVLSAGHEPPVPPDVLAAVAGSRLLKGPEDATALELFEIATRSGPSSGDAETLLKLSASLIPTLVAPTTSGMELWLEAPPGLDDFVEIIKGFTRNRISLWPSGALDFASRDKRIDDFVKVAEEARNWLANAASGRTQHKRSSDVRAHLARNELRTLLDPVAQDRRAGAAEVRRLAGQWRDRRFVIDQINRVDRELTGLKASQITGNPREQIVREVDDACDIALRWCEMVSRESLIESRGDWFFEQVTKFRERLRDCAPAVESAVRQFAAGNQPPGVRAGAFCLKHSLARMYTLLQLGQDAGKQTERGPDDDLPGTGANSLHQLLVSRLKLLPGVEIADNGEPASGTEAKIAGVLRVITAHDDRLQAVVDGWLKLQDFRFIAELVELAEREDHPELTTLKRRWREELAGSREALRIAIDKTSDEVEQAIVDGIIGEARSDYSARLQEIDPERELNFPPAFAKLQSVREDLSAERNRRKGKQEADWIQLQERLSSARLADAQKEQAVAVMEAALAQGDARIVDEYLADLREVLDSNKELSANWSTPAPGRNVFTEFIDALPRLEAWLKEQQGLANIVSEVRSGGSGAGINFGALLGPRREESAAALEAWRQLRRLQARASDREMLPLVTTVLNRFLGFNADSPAPGLVSVKGRGRDWVNIEVSVSSSTLSPVPHFGSREDGRLAVLCFWDRPSSDTIVPLLRDLRLGTRSVLVLYVGRLGQSLDSRQRGEIAQICRKENLSLAVLDEMLLIFLAGEAGLRLPSFLRCALPFSGINPYTPHQAGDVPPEMFFGREQMSRDLQDSGGSCLVYGGRQFGKSALLRHVKREFHHPHNEHYAWVEDINVVGDPKGGRSPDVIWRRLRDRFKEAKLLDPHTSTDDPEAIYEKIRDVMRMPGLRVLALFDEADHFLDADSKEGFKVVSDLRRLMTETRRRFKVVFAGLHNVYRFQGIPNQPLAHFGTPICVGPLEAGAAQDLIQAPLNALGYTFVERAGVLRVLSYTNYHPGLIQLFCWELLRRLHSRSGDFFPPYAIQQSDVEAVYRIQNVRDDIRDRFDWTLALDKHYQAIAWRLIYEQIAISDNFARTFSQREVLKLAKDAWAKGFAGVDDEELHGLLEEMCGLGVLVRTEEGEYRLRSPNLVRLVGSEEKILADLVSLSEEDPEVTFDADSHHILLDEQTHVYSPLTHAQERGLAPPKFGVGLVFASEALGIGQLPDAFEKLVPDGTPAGTWLCEEVQGDQDTPAALNGWLTQCLNRNPSKQRFVVWLRVRRPPRDTAAMIEAAISFCKKREGRNRWMRVFFIFDSAASWRWCQLPEGHRLDVEARVGAGAVASPKRWNLLGIAQRLKQMELLDTKQVCEGVAEATGGWPWLLDHLFERISEGLDPRESVSYMAGALAPDGHLVSGFKAALGVGDHSAPQRILQFITGELGAPVELIDPELLSEEGSPISAAECVGGLEFLKRMGCVEVRDDVAHVAPLVGRVLIRP